jgi:hypothetical protein
VMWLPVNASWLDQIEIWFSILQRKLLQPNHFLSTVCLQQAISDFIAYYNQKAKPIQWSSTVEKLERKRNKTSEQKWEMVPQSELELSATIPPLYLGTSA